MKMFNAIEYNKRKSEKKEIDIGRRRNVRISKAIRKHCHRRIRYGRK